MELTPEILSAGAVGLLIIAGAVGNYIQKLRAKPAELSPMLSGIAGGFVDREQMERLIAAVNRVAEAVADKNAASITDRLDDLADKIDHMRPGRR
jgi:Zn-dependent protease with chaperone function